MDNEDVGYKFSIYSPEYHDSILCCSNCSQLLDSIRLTMAPKEAVSFMQCIVEIEEFDGHLIAERFLRLYSALHVYNNISEVKT